MNKTNYNILSVIFIVIIVGLLAKMYQSNEHFETLSRLERGKKVCKSNSYNPWTMSVPDEDDIKNIINTVLQYINQKVNMNYHLDKIDNLTKEYDYEGNTRYLIDFFTFHLDPTKKNDLNRRFILDITKKQNKILKINMITVGNAKKYKHPNELSLPELEDNELILKDTNLINTHNIVGKVNPILDYGIDVSDIDIKHLSGVKHNYQSWILPKEASQKTEIYPCRKQHKWWDINGVHYTDNPTKMCKGLDTSITERPVIAEFEPGHINLLSDKNIYTWLFDKARGRQSSTEPLVGATPEL